MYFSSCWGCFPRARCTCSHTNKMRLYIMFSTFQHIDSVMDTIEKGYRMECPDGCPQKVYIVMRDCWEINPKLRPSFEKIYTTLDDIYRSFVTGNKCE